jgi:cytoskeleton protein RodZ
MNESAAAPGPRLKAEREQRGLSAQKAADQMHLDRWVIDALEADDYTRIGPTVYAKGHLKKYAALLGLPAAEILAGYEVRAQGTVQTASAGPSMLLSTRSEGPGLSSLSALQVAACVALVLLIIGVVWWKPWQQHAATVINSGPAPAAVISEASAGAESSTASNVANNANPVDVPVSSAPETQSEAPFGVKAMATSAPAIAPPADAPPAAALGAGHARLRLSFSADSWVDIRDASGKRQFAGNGLANSVKTIAGMAPMQVYLGFGSGVQLEINDRAVAIGPQFFAGDVARFEAGADGVLRRDAHPDQTHGAQSRSARPPG